MKDELIWKKVDFPSEKRIIVISDIHGNLPFFKGLLQKLSFSPEDILVLLGDMLEKGENNLETLRYIMELEKTHQVYPLCGNCDAYVKLFFESDKHDKDFFQEYFTRPKTEHSILLQMGREAGVKDLENLENLRQTLRITHKSIWEWLGALPTILESEDYFFVHGGIDSMDYNPNIIPWECMKNDYFHSQKHHFPKYMVVGHCPTTLYRPDYQDASPLIDHLQKLISIDGGCVLKLDGQLNALILENGEISWDYYDGLPLVRAISTQKASKNPLNIRWGHNQIEIIERREDFSLCLHLESGRTIEILTDFIQERDGKYYCEDATDYLLPVEKGEILSLSQPIAHGFLGKKQGVTGWYLGDYEYVK